MKQCPYCESRTMVRVVADGEVYFQCPCSAREKGKPEDRLLKSGGNTSVGNSEKYNTLTATAAHSQAVLKVAKDCPSCGLPYLTLVRVGDEETIIFTCKNCGRIPAKDMAKESQVA
jgi:DNA-directed RNA polymerase subunit M/transcription elongation factor TFIIS